MKGGFLFVPCSPLFIHPCILQLQNTLLSRCNFPWNEQNAQSMLTFEGTQVQGAEQVIAKLQSVGAVKHNVKTMDIQPSANPNSIVIFVTGAIQIGGDNPLHFCEFFHLVSTGGANYYVHNDVFRLNYGL